jgi:peptidyl-tRNA hydrolase, PTH1 family
MKFLVTGLGNPGAEYENTRHNIGFKVLDKLAADLAADWEKQKHGWIAKGTFKGKSLILLKPDTFMNISGKAVSYWMQQEKIKLEGILVVTDDLALPTAKLRLKTKGADGGHNGLRSIDATLGTQNYARLRFGVGNDFLPGRQVNYVLGEFKNDEKELVLSAIENAEAIKLFATIGAAHTMTKVNA